MNYFDGSIVSLLVIVAVFLWIIVKVTSWRLKLWHRWSDRDHLR